MFSKFKNVSFFIKLLSLVFVLSIIVTALPIQAAEFYPKNDKDQNVDIKATRDNIYAVGSEIKSEQNVAKDLVVAGSKITITGNVGRSIIAAGSEITINSNRVGGATRVAGATVKISGNFAEEVIVAGSEVIIENTTINGDLIVAASKLTLKNSRISGDAKLSYSESVGDLEAQVLGNVTKNVGQNKDKQGVFESSNVYNFLITQFNVIVFLFLAVYILRKRNGLAIKSIEFGNKFWKDLAIGLGFVVLTLPAVIVLSILQLYPLALLLGSIIYLSYILSSFFFPIYLANFIKNTFKVDMEISNLVIVTYVVVAILSFIPIVNIISFLVFFVIQAANFGYITGFVKQAFFSNKEASSHKSNIAKHAPEDGIDSDDLEDDIEKSKVKKTSKPNNKTDDKKLPNQINL